MKVNPLHHCKFSVWCAHVPFCNIEYVFSQDGLDDSEMDVDDDDEDDEEEEDEEDEVIRTMGPRKELGRPSRRSQQTKSFVEHDSDF